MLRQLSRLLGRNDERQPARQPPPKPKSYAAVSVEASGKGACRAAKLLTGHRFLVGSAPRLPLAACDREVCNCRYRHYADRRQEPRRDIDVGIASRFYVGEERRSIVGRRATDRAR